MDKELGAAPDSLAASPVVLARKLVRMCLFVGVAVAVGRGVVVGYARIDPFQRKAVDRAGSYNWALVGMGIDPAARCGEFVRVMGIGKMGFVVVEGRAMIATKLG